MSTSIELPDNTPAGPLAEPSHGPPAAPAGKPSGEWAHLRQHLPTFPEAAASLLRTVVVGLFVLTFVMQPLLIPSESMEHTLLVGDFLLFNKQVFAPPGGLTRWLLPYRPVERGDIVVFYHRRPPLLIKRVVGLPGDRLRIQGGKVFVNGAPLEEPYAAYEPAPPSDFRDNFPAGGNTFKPSHDAHTYARTQVQTYSPDPQVDPQWWRQMQRLTQNGELVVPPGEYFVLGDNRNYSSDSRYWGFVPRQAIEARPLVIYFSVRRPSSTDVQQAADDRLGHDSDFPARLLGFARWGRIFHVVH
jgi:signal peptidase I